MPLSPHLFNIFLADLEEELEKGWLEGVTIGKLRIYCPSYADDIVVLAEAEKMRELMKRLEKYLKQKRLCLNVEKKKWKWRKQK